MRKRIAIAVGGLGILILVWILSWNKYQDEIGSPQLIENKEEESEKTISKPYRSKRFPAAKIKINRPVKKIDFDSILIMRDLKPASKTGINLHPSTSINSARSSYAVTTNIRVVPKSERHRYDDSQIVDQKYGKIFVKEVRGVSDSIVLQNSKTRQLAIMTGVFKIKLHDHNNWSALQSDYDLLLEGNFPGIRLSLQKTEDVSNAPAILEQLIKDPRVERAELEILENPPMIK